MCSIARSSLFLAAALFATSATAQRDVYEPLGAGSQAPPPAGSPWQALGTGTDSPVYTSASAPGGSLYAGGAFGQAGGMSTNYVARWDGTTWHALGAGMNDTVLSLAVSPGGSVYAGGTFTTAGNLPARHVARWDGTAWRALGAGIAFRVAALAASPDGMLYAGGDFLWDTYAIQVMRWNGSAWSALGESFNGPVTALALGPEGTLYAGGAFTMVGGSTVNGIARWDGVTWHPLGEGMGNGGSGSSVVVYTLTVAPSGALYAGGAFTTAGGTPASRVAQWDGAAWYPLGEGVDGSTGGSTVRSLALGPDGAVYAGGTFTIAGDVPANRIARWDGGTWHALGEGVTGALAYVGVLDLTFLESGRLAVAGAFEMAGGLPSLNTALYDPSGNVAGEPELPAEAGTTLGLTVGPNPAYDAATAWVDVPTGAASLTIYDALGRRVAVGFDGDVSGPAAVRLPVERLAPGVYVVRLATGRAVRTARLVVAR